eukprot:c39516_g1_i1.p2 GENE.c39516_g1_i1~~c39516_g1_i1.p2  ORF type:complete len:149 (-),score=6.72 c39516_g1_i1:560-1006(-)
MHVVSSSAAASVIVGPAAAAGAAAATARARGASAVTPRAALHCRQCVRLAKFGRRHAPHAQSPLILAAERLVAVRGAAHRRHASREPKLTSPQLQVQSPRTGATAVTLAVALAVPAGVTPPRAAPHLRHTARAPKLISAQAHSQSPGT